MYFVLGAIAGALLVYLRVRQVERERGRREEEIMRLRQEQDLVVRSLRDIVEALGETPTRGELFRRIVHAAMRGTQALSACFFELQPDGRLQGIVVEGLFPPQRALPEGWRARLATRARCLEQILRSEVLDPGEGVIGQVARTRLAELVPDGTRDARIPRHDDDDEAFVVRSLIAAPLVLRETLLGVLAVANPATQQAFTSADLALVRALAELAGIAFDKNDRFAARQPEAATKRQ